MMAERRYGNALERHAQTGLTALGVMLIGWVGLTTQTTQVKLAELSVQVKNLEYAIRAPEPRVNDLTRRVEIIEKAILLEDGRD